MSQPYRVAPVHVLCARCRQPAVFCCPGCRTATCHEHTQFVDLCPDCSLALNAAERRAGWRGGGLIASLGLAAALGVGLWWPISTLIGGLAGLIYCGLRQAQQYRRFHQRSAVLVLEGACLSVARGVPEEDWRSHRGVGYQCRTRGEVPEVPFYQRTYTGI